MNRMPNWAAWALGIAGVLAVISVLLSISGCCPISLRPEVVHVSHISQHFQDKYDSSLGYNAVMLDLHLEPARHLEVDIADGAVLGPQHVNAYGNPYVNGLMGPREVFSATIAWDIPVHR